VERLFILQVWRNFVKQFSERRGGGTPAQRIGLCQRALRVKEILRSRLFPSQFRLPARLTTYYRRETKTPALGVNRIHRLNYAY
jgi:hypothetical protein